MFGIHRRILNKREILPVLREHISQASKNLSIEDSREAISLELQAPGLIDLAEKYLRRIKNVSRKNMNEACRTELLAAFVSYCGYRSIKSDQHTFRNLAKEAIQVGLRSIGIKPGQITATAMEFAVLKLIVSDISKFDWDSKDILGFELPEDSAQKVNRLGLSRDHFD